MDVFRSFFGFGNRNGRDRKEPPTIFFSGEDDHDDDNEDVLSQFPFFFGGGNDGGSSIDDMFRHFHGDMWRQMESLHQQMEDMMKGCGTITSENFPPIDKHQIFDNPNKDPEERGKTWIFGDPFGSDNKKSSPRDFMLKDKDTDDKSNLNPVLPDSSHDSNRFRFSFDFKNPFNPFPGVSTPDNSKEDTDLDGKVSNEEVMDLIKKPSPDNHPRHEMIPDKGFLSNSSSVIITTFTGPDGKVERKKVVRDSSGREENTISRSLDGQSHTVTTVIGPNGLEEKREDFKNMDQNDINKFEEKWNTLPKQPPPVLSPPSGPFHPRLHPNDVDIFSRFFR